LNFIVEVSSEDTIFRTIFSSNIYDHVNISSTSYYNSICGKKQHFGAHRFWGPFPAGVYGSP